MATCPPGAVETAEEPSALPVQQNVAVEELRRPVQDVPHGGADALQRLLAPRILVPRPSLLLALEHHDDEHLGRTPYTARSSQLPFFLSTSFFPPPPTPPPPPPPGESLESLRVFLQGTAPGSAPRMHIRNQTLVCRMRRVEELTSRNLAGTADLWLALQAAAPSGLVDR